MTETTAIRPTIVCLCGSTRFKDAFTKAQFDETLAGKIVLTIGCNMRSDAELFAHMSEEERADVKRDLDALHMRKIEMADEVLILNVDGYIGESTRNELRHAAKLKKCVRFLEPPPFPYDSILAWGGTDELDSPSRDRANILRCKHRLRHFIQSGRAAGDGDNYRYQVDVCRDCGQFSVHGQFSGVWVRVNFTVDTREALAAAARWIEELEADGVNA